MTPEQLPAAVPQVSYLNGQLTIISQNSTLGDILNAVRARTGAQIEVSAPIRNERVAVRIGPGPAQQVIASLLGGSKYDYMILGSPSVPGGVQYVKVSKREGAPAQGTAVASGPQPGMSGSPQPGGEFNPDVEDEPFVDTTGTMEPPDQPTTPQPEESAPGQAEGQPGTIGQPIQPQAQPVQPQQTIGQPIAPSGQPGEQQDQQQQQQPQGTPSQIKTPEQLLQELQRLQQQQQQQRQQDNPNNPR